MAALYFVIWIYGGIANGPAERARAATTPASTTSSGGPSAVSYLLLYWYRKHVEDPKREREGAAMPAEAAGD